ncbi:MAG: enoyl-CoA hydratase/isomerase family protein [Bacillus sp. (in: firmicutes)]
MSNCLVKTLVGESILQLTINRPDKRNAISYEVMDELDAAIDWAKEDERVKILLIRGAGGQAFCSGGDLSEFHALETEEAAFGMLSKMGQVLYKLATFSKPTIAYINGTAIGGGCEIATACDIRIAKKGVKMGFVQGHQAITTGWGCGTILTEKLSPANAMALLWSADIMLPEEAMELGFISEVTEDDEQVLTILERYNDKQGEVLQAYKNMLVRKWEQTNLRERMMEEIKVCAKLWEKEEHLLAVKRFRERKK